MTDFWSEIMHLSSQAQEGGGGGERLGKPQEFDCDVYPQGGDFDHLMAEKK